MVAHSVALQGLRDRNASLPSGAVGFLFAVMVRSTAPSPSRGRLKSGGLRVGWAAVLGHRGHCPLKEQHGWSIVGRVGVGKYTDGKCPALLVVRASPPTRCTCHRVVVVMTSTIHLTGDTGRRSSTGGLAALDWRRHIRAIGNISRPGKTVVTTRCCLALPLNTVCRPGFTGAWLRSTIGGVAVASRTRSANECRVTSSCNHPFSVAGRSRPPPAPSTTDRPRLLHRPPATYGGSTSTPGVLVGAMKPPLIHGWSRKLTPSPARLPGRSHRRPGTGGQNNPHSARRW